MAVFLAFLVACATAPITGRRQFLIVSESDEVSQGEKAFQYILRNSVVSRNPEAIRIVRKVGLRIAQGANKPNYNWEFHVLDDPEMVNAFAVPGGKVAVYTGIFPIARDEVGLAVILGHEVAHALARHAGERMSQDMLVQLGGAALSVGLGSNPAILQAYGLGAGLGLILPFSRSQESEADEIGLILMAKAGYDPRASLGVWKRMEGKGKNGPPEFISTHPGYETRTKQLRTWIPEALKSYRPTSGRNETLPSLKVLDTATGRAERELLKRVQRTDQKMQSAQDVQALLKALGYIVRADPELLKREREAMGVSYGSYAALKGVSYLGRGSLRAIFADYRRGRSWTEITTRHGTRVTKVISFMGQLLRATATVRSRYR